MLFIRACIAAVLTAAVIVTLALVTAPGPQGRALSAVRITPHVQQEASLVGLNDTVGSWGRYGALLEQAHQADVKAQEAARPAVHVAPRAQAGGSVNWDGIAMCETGGNWQHQTRFDGGLGIYHGAWTDFGGREFAEYGSQATKEQQIIVAERIYARYGLSGWGCKAYG